MPVDPAAPPPSTEAARLADRIGQLERQVRNLTSFMQGGVTAQIPVVSSLPPPGRQGRILMLASTSAVWKDDGASWSLV